MTSIQEDGYVLFLNAILRTWESTTVWGTRNVGEIVGDRDDAHIERFSSIKAPMSYTTAGVDGTIHCNLNIFKGWLRDNCVSLGKMFPPIDYNGFMRIETQLSYGLVVNVVKADNFITSKYNYHAINTLTGETLMLGELNQDITDSMNILSALGEEFGVSIHDNSLSIDVMQITLTGNLQSRLGCNIQLHIG